MAIVESDLGRTHIMDMDGIAVFGASAAEVDAIAEESGELVEVIHLDLKRREDLGRQAINSVNTDLSADPN